MIDFPPLDCTEWVDAIVCFTSGHGNWVKLGHNIAMTKTLTTATLFPGTQNIGVVLVFVGWSLVPRLGSLYDPFVDVASFVISLPDAGGKNRCSVYT